MATCKNCGKTLILRGGKCFYCGQNPHETIVSSSSNQTPYTKYVGQNHIIDAQNDRFGNAQGSQYDLSKDGAFKGYTIIVLCLYQCIDVPSKNIMANSTPALQKKGFRTITFGLDATKDINLLHKELNNDKCQLWIISDMTNRLTPDCCNLIYNHFNKGRGLYIWSDNEPYYADANVILRRLFNTEMSGCYVGDHVLSVQSIQNTPGIVKGHPITTGIQNFYEGITISNVRLTQNLKPLVYSSDGKVVTAYYDMYGKRGLIDGGFTRLYCKWNSAGTDRFVVNCASWLANIETFGYTRQ